MKWRLFDEARGNKMTDSTEFYMEYLFRFFILAVALIFMLIFVVLFKRLRAQSFVQEYMLNRKMMQKPASLSDPIHKIDKIGEELYLLAVVMIGNFASLIYSIYYDFTHYRLDPLTSEAFHIKQPSAYDWLVNVEAAMLIIFAFTTLYVLILFFKKSTIFVNWFLFLYLSMAAAAVAAAMVRLQLFPQIEILKAFDWQRDALIFAIVLIFIPYIIYSKRVKATFI